MDDSVSLKCTLNRTYLPVDKKSIVYLAIEVLPPAIINQSEPLPSAICLLIDRSGSMRGQKLQQAKAAASNLLNQLQPGDYIGLVTFSNKVEEITILDKIQNQDMLNLNRKIDRLTCGGGTELYRALDTVYQQFLRSGITSPDMVKRIILLSDGQPDDHIPESFYIKLAKEMGETGISVMALGLGTEYNEDLLSEIAEHSRGMSKHISKADELPAIFSQQLNDTRVVIRVKPEILLHLTDNVEMKMMYKFMPEAFKITDIKSNGTDIVIPLSDMKIMEPQKLVIQLSAPPAPEGQCCLAKVQIADEPASQQDIMVTYTRDEHLWGTEENPDPRGTFLTAETQVLTRAGLSGDHTALSRAKELAETILADQSLTEIHPLQETATTIRQTIGKAENGLTDEETKVAKQDITRIRRR